MGQDDNPPSARRSIPGTGLLHIRIPPQGADLKESCGSTGEYPQAGPGATPDPADLQARPASARPGGPVAVAGLTYRNQVHFRHHPRRAPFSGATIAPRRPTLHRVLFAAAIPPLPDDRFGRITPPMDGFIYFDITDRARLPARFFGATRNVLSRL